MPRTHYYFRGFRLALNYVGPEQIRAFFEAVVQTCLSKRKCRLAGVVLIHQTSFLSTKYIVYIENTPLWWIAS